MDFTIVSDIARIAGDAYATGEHALGAQAMNVIILAFGIAIYASIVGTFYLRISKRRLFRLNMDIDKEGTSKTIEEGKRVLAFFIQYTIVFPLISFFWFLLLAVSLALLSKNVDLSTVFVASLSVVAAIRITAYYDENISVDLAKLLPLAMLGVFIVNPAEYSQVLITERITLLGQQLAQFLPYLSITVGLEWILRLALGVQSFLFENKNAQPK